MQLLRDITKFSNYRPSGGLKGELYRLTVEEELSRKEAEAYFEEREKKGQFLVVYKRLKDSLLDGVLQTSLKIFPKRLQIRFKNWKKHLQTKILLQTGSRAAGIKLAIETITNAEQNEQFQIVHSICRDLINHYSSNELNNLKYNKYRKKLILATKYLNDEIEVESSYRDLLFCYRTKISFTHVAKKISELDQIAINNSNYKFRYFYFSLKSLYFQIEQKETELVENNKLAYAYFNSLAKEMSHVVKYNFLMPLAPIYIIKNQFSEAESTINSCLSLTEKGSYNWHTSLFHQAYLGFYTNKLSFAIRALNAAKSIPVKDDSKAQFSTWETIEGYLAFFIKARNLNTPTSFKLYKYLNQKEKRGDDFQKAHLVIMELLHLLVDKKYKRYLEKTERIEGLIATRFKAHNHKRIRYFLRMLKTVVRGNYHRKLVTAHARKQMDNLNDSKKELDINILDKEIVPYELLWEEVLGTLRGN